MGRSGEAFVELVDSVRATGTAAAVLIGNRRVETSDTLLLVPNHRTAMEARVALLLFQSFRVREIAPIDAMPFAADIGQVGRVSDRRAAAYQRRHRAPCP